MKLSDLSVCILLIYLSNTRCQSCALDGLSVNVFPCYRVLVLFIIQGLHPSFMSMISSIESDQFNVIGNLRITRKHKQIETPDSYSNCFHTFQI